LKRLKVMTVFGTRPEAIKMAPLVTELKKCDQIETVVCVTAQHRQMLDQVLEIFNINADYDLDIMKDKQTLIDITTRALERLSVILDKTKPDIVLVHGDTTTTFVGSLAAFYKKISVGHVEAGLRTYDKYFPYPEEINRRLTGVIADLHFVVREGVDESKIYITGNTVIDALKTTVVENYDKKRIITVTAHRRENLGEPLHNICEALKHIADRYDDIEIVYPVHLNPAVHPLDVQDMHNLMARSYLIMTDSGGLQEEAPSLGKPVLVLRNETERPEAVKAGTVKLAGTEKENIIRLTEELLDNKTEYDKMAKAVNPYGDGFASERIVKALLFEFGLSKTKPEGFDVKI